MLSKALQYQRRRQNGREKRRSLVDDQRNQAVLHALDVDLDSLHNLNSDQRRARKRRLIEKYHQQVRQLMRQDSWQNLRLLFYWLLWKLDTTDDFQQIEPLLWQGVERGLTTHGRFNRDWPTFYADTLRDWAEKHFAEHHDLPDWFLQRLDELERHTINPAAASKLHKLAGHLLEARGRPHEALRHYQRAQQLNERAGCKQHIRRLQERLNRKQEDQEQTEPKREEKDPTEEAPTP